MSPRPGAAAWVLAALVGCPKAGAPPTPASEVPGIPASCGPLEPAVVPILPRTSNNEVLQLVSDLLGAPVDPSLFSRWTPLAQVRGFDTMTESRIDTQTLEEQLRTTEAVADLLVRSANVMAACPVPVAQQPACTVHDSYDSTNQFSGEQGRDCWSYLDADGTPLTFDATNQIWTASDPGLFIWNTGLHPGVGVDVIRRWTAPLDGTVNLQGNVGDADGGGGDGIIVDIRGPAGSVFQAVIVNGGAAESFNIPLAVRRSESIDIVVQRNASNSYDSTALSATFGFSAAPATAGLAWENCGAPVVERIAARAWRRPLRAEEQADLKRVFDATSSSATVAGIPGTFIEGLRATLQAALLSPHVQYKPEFVPGTYLPSEHGFRRASRVALYFRSSFPDDELWALASANALDDDALAQQAERLLADDGNRFVDNFGGQWLNFRAPIGASEEPLAQSMRRESRDVFASVLDDHLPPQSLIAPGFTIVDGPLAAHYGLPLEAASGPARIDTSERGGIFTQGHFLTSSSTGSEFKRVIHRGIFTLNRTLCRSVPILDPATLEEIAASVGGIDPTLPLAERMQLHRESSTRCVGCHSRMDPLGLALENFDETGRWRDTYADGSVINNDYDFDGTPVHNASELGSYIGESTDYRRCVAEKLFTFGLNRSLRTEEGCVVDSLAASDDGAARSLHDIAIDAFVASLHLTETP